MVREESSLTHSEEDCSEAAFSYVMAIRDLIQGKNTTVCRNTNNNKENLTLPQIGT